MINRKWFVNCMGTLRYQIDGGAECDSACAFSGARCVAPGARTSTHTPSM